MEKYALAIQKIGSTTITPYTLLIGKNHYEEYICNLFDDEIKIVPNSRISDVDLNSLKRTLKTFITNEIGRITNISVIPNDPALIDFLQRLRE